MRMTIRIQVDADIDMPEEVFKQKIKHELGIAIGLLIENRTHAMNIFPTGNAADALWVDQVLQEMVVEIS